MTDLSKQPNIGKDTESKLVLAGIDSYAELRQQEQNKLSSACKHLIPAPVFSYFKDLRCAIDGIQAFS